MLLLKIILKRHQAIYLSISSMRNKFITVPVFDFKVDALELAKMTAVPPSHNSVFNLS